MADAPLYDALFNVFSGLLSPAKKAAQEASSSSSLSNPKYTDLTKSVDERLKDRGYRQDTLDEMSSAITQGGTFGVWPIGQPGEDLSSSLFGNKEDEEPESEWEKRGKAIENSKNLYPGLAQETISPETDPLIFYEPGRSRALAPEDRPEGMNRGNQYLQTPSTSREPTTEMDEFHETSEQPVSGQAKQADQSYTSRKPTTEMDEFYETLRNNPELAEKYAEYLDEDNYGYSRARASQNSDLFADLALADPRIMQRFKNSGVDVEDLENLSNNIYKYMWEDNLIDLYDYYDNKGGYLGDSDKSVIDMLGFLMQDSNYNFDSDFLRRYGLTPEDAMVQALIRNAYAGGAREYDLGRITDLMRRSGYLTDDEELTWGDVSDSWWVDNDKNRANLPEYVSLRDTQYLDPQMGVYDTNAALSLADAMAIADSKLLDANGKAPSRRVVVSSKNPQKNKQKAFDSSVLDASMAGTGLGYY